MARFRIRIPARSDLWSSFRFGHHCCLGWGWGWIGAGSNHGGRKVGPGAGAVSIGLRIAQHGPVVLALQVLYGEWENFITLMAQFLTVAFNETSTFTVFADNASRSFC